ncbi:MULTISPECIES: hypothetical protein [Burkholderia cepacia complex]|jgi:hypothetical protein|uniref:hypothetical protein n=1 Tax=Burkholderia cepacia complex TaxID=87882 RepID=UPI00158F05C9|nr:MULTISPECIES: hypothetical protein [Burkholderia cepacia complex]MCA8037055.1 hypothetical protein [Burkholderia arboris]
MGLKTERIRFNVTERGRKHRGQDRKFDTRTLAAIINGPEVQEKVRNRDMIGYYGHWARRMFGLEPVEFGVHAGKTLNLEPALVTTFLSADDQGNVEHEEEFLDTSAGKIAARLHVSRTGGFSSAIGAKVRGGKDVPYLFAGFDYVIEPNYTTNRGYLLDSVTEDVGESVFDSVSVASEISCSLTAMNALYDSLQSDHVRTLDVLAKLEERCAEYESMLVTGRAGAVLDSAGARPLLVGTAATAQFERMNAMFAKASLPSMEQEPREADEPTPGLEAAQRHYGVR